MKPEIQAAALIIKAKAVVEVLEIITAGADARQAGTKAHLLAFVLGVSPHQTQRELARAIGLTPGRVCQMLNAIRRQFPQSS